jgi:4-hydroxy-3-polyprenylbenzoate decarboxylase
MAIRVEAPCQEVILTGDELTRPDDGLARLPVPISTPGFDAAPYLTVRAFQRHASSPLDTDARGLGQIRANTLI